MKFKIEVYASGRGRGSLVQGCYVIVSERFIPKNSEIRKLVANGIVSFAYVMDDRGNISLLADKYINMPIVDKLL